MCEVDVKEFPRDRCTVAATLEVIGERWTIRVLGEVFLGVRRFEDFRRNIGVARNILSDRLNTLVAEGILRRELYSERPPRYEYRLTEKGLELYGVLIELGKWGNKWQAGPDGPPLVLRHQGCGAVMEPVHTCPECGERVGARDLRAEPGPAALKRATA
jgi:DNA-binding HxlR family transcriptional regulator